MFDYWTLMLLRLPERLDRPLAPAVMTAVIYGVFLFARLAVHAFEPSYFVVAGADLFDSASADPSLGDIRDGPGYDGQFYYRLAIEPFSKKMVDHGIRFDSPAYRQQRILYPALAWILSAGVPRWVPAALIVVNYVGLCAIGWLGGALAQSISRHSLWGLSFSLYPGFIFTLSRDLTEIVASSFLLAGLLFMQRSRHGLSAICLSLAVFARETTLLVPAAVLISSALRPRVRVKGNSFLYYASPLVLYTIWRLYVASVWSGYPAVRIFGGAIGWPFMGIADLWSRTLAIPNRELIIWSAETILLGCSVLYGIRLFSRHEEFSAERIALLFYAGMVSCLTAGYWPEDQGFLRATTETFVLAALALLLDASRIQLTVFLAWMVAAFYTFGWRVEW